MSITEKRSFPPSAVLLIGILAASTASIFIRFAQAEAPSISIAAYRLSIAVLLLTPFVLIRHGKEVKQLQRRQLPVMLLAGLFLALHFGAWISSLEYTSIASSVVLVTTTPLWVALISTLFLREKLTQPIVIGLIIAMLGGVAVGAAESCAITSGQFVCDFNREGLQNRTMIGNSLALFGAWMMAAYLVVGRKTRQSMPTMVYVYIVYAFAALFLLLLCLVTAQPLIGFSNRFYLWVLLLALFPQIIGHTSYNWALGYLPTTFVSIALLGEPIGTILLSFLLLNESPAFLESLGAILLLIGIYLASRGSSQK
ncbi:MAG: DMT family transporter [Anaerolineae bacterium]|jgi:drug/metabolite transporter (DMT)-like permease|nr:DMT family transporter [Anaerolineae bacterium]